MRRFFTPVLILFIIALVPVVMHMIGGTGSRYFADDYCIYLESASADPVALTMTWYGNSGGRLAQYLSMAVLFKGDVDLAAVMPAILLTAWLIGCAWLGAEIGRSLRVSVISGMLVGILATALIVAATPDEIQSFYWLTGSLTYTVPCIVGTFAAALIVRLARRLALNQGIHPLHLVGLFALCLTAGLFNEPYTLVQGALVGCGLLFTLMYAREQRGWWLTLITAALASLTALIILVIAPGNSVRQTFFVAAPSPLTALVQSVQYALIFTASAINFNPPGVIMAILVGIAIPGVVQRKSIQRGDTHASQWTRRKYLMLMVLYITAWLLVCTAFMFPGLYATQMPPPGRSFAIIMWVYMPWWVGLGALLRLSLWGNARLNAGVERWNMRLVRLAVVVHAVWAVNEAILPVTYSLSYGAEWDARAATLTTATATDDIIVVPLPHELATIRGLDTIGADSSFWVNICAARYYGVRSLRTSDGEI